MLRPDVRQKTRAARLATVPLLVGVTGHRDLPEAAQAPLEARVSEIIDALALDCRHTPVVLLSSLAEGADRLVARVALARGARLVAVLPMPRALYEEDFASDASKDEFRALLRSAERTIEIAPRSAAPASTLDRREQYALAGAYIARHTHALIALWDGQPSKRTGGTADAVRFMLEGVPARYGGAHGPLDPPRGAVVYHIITPRARAETTPPDLFAVRRLYSRGFASEPAAERARACVRARVDAFNADALRLGPSRAARREIVASSLLPERARVAHVDDDDALAPLERLADHCATADDLSLHFQRKMRDALLQVLSLVFLAALFFHLDLLQSRDARSIASMLYPLALAASYVAYLRARRGDYQNKYQDYRALAEGLRVQLYWRLVGLNDEVSAHYLRRQRDELEWIGYAVDACDFDTSDDDALVDSSPRAPQGERLRFALARWIGGQADYFASASVREEGRSRRLKWIGYVLLAVGLALAVVKIFLRRDHPLAVVAALTPVAAALIHSYLDKRALDVHARQYGRMSLLFARARAGLSELLDEGRLAEAQSLVLELGKEALAENAGWVMLHRARPLEVIRAR
ncbi:MAG: hypothetical protein QOE33_2271 [Acidobacteriota bacterium]|nr:hypothetical protein [Acidobacteriota bacterium]